MCGIVGYIGHEEAAPILLDGLSKLEYRGYDSAGVAVYSKERIVVEKCKGRLQVLADKLDGGRAISGTMGIGHTRWATHGAPSDENSHPHTNEEGTFAVVHNGIIENYLKLKEFLGKRGYHFKSDTDTEVIAHLFDYCYTGDMLDTAVKLLEKIEGSYALGILSRDCPDEMIAVRKDSPLIVGVSERGNFIASDVPAILPYTRDVYYLEEQEIVRLTREGVTIYNMDREVLHKELHHISWDVSAAEKGGYEHFMMKEIMEQPRALRDTVGPRIKDGKIVFEELDVSPEYIKNIQKIFIVACGSAYHVGMVGKYILEDMARIPVEVDLASEFRYRNPIVSENTLVIAISQSGETADTIAAIREARRLGAKILSVVNVVGSSIARESDSVIYTWAGPEIAVATTKAYSTQLAVMYLLAGYFASVLGTCSAGQLAAVIQNLTELPDLVEQVLNDKERLQYYASKYYNSKNVFFIGRGIDYAVSLEGSLKLKEISYINSEAYAAGELKHGTISLIEDGTFVIALATQDRLFPKMLSNIKEVKSRGAVVMAIAKEGNTEIEQEADFVFYIPDRDDFAAPSLAVIQLQLFAYYVAVTKGCDVDKPRNLAKSVTVE